MNGNIPAQIVNGRVVARKKILCLLLGMMAVVTGNDLQGDRRKWRDLVQGPDFTSGSETLFPKELSPSWARVHKVDSNTPSFLLVRQKRL